MGHAYATILISNPRQPKLRPVEVKAMADTGAITLCIPEHVALQLKLETHEERTVRTADGRKQRVPYVGPVEVKFDNRSSFGGAMVMGDEVLLGAVQMEDMDLIVIPRMNAVVVNPESPNIPTVNAKRGK